MITGVFMGWSCRLVSSLLPESKQYPNAVGYAIAGLGKDLAIAHYQRREGAAATSDGIHRKCHTLPEKLPVLFNRHFHPLDAVRLSA
jgi:hypothetical protein